MKMNEVITTTQKIITDVKKYGDVAVVKYTRKFDNIKNFTIKDIKIKVPSNYNIADKKFISCIQLAIKNVYKFHLQELKNIKTSWSFEHKGITIGQKLIPLDSVGVYIPGGRYGFNYISTLIMSVIPAKVAGVKKIVVTTPPRNVTKYFLFTSFLLGIKEIYAVGGVQAIAALALGTKTIPKVDMIVGPGNIWVTEAKRQLAGVVGIDLLAGPSEVAVVADSSVPLDEILYELLAQAEHDKHAQSYLIGLDNKVIKSIKSKLYKEYKEFVPQIKFIQVKTLKEAVKIVNDIAPEHLTVLVDKFTDYFLNNTTNAGAIFLGKNSSSVLGDYIVGPSHILPTNRTAKFSSGVSVVTFIKKISIIKIKSSTVNSNLFVAGSKLAEIEGMKFHKMLLDEKAKRSCKKN